jgi:hypothetical protein
LKEEPRTALMMSQNNEETYQESDDNYLLPKQLKREEVLRLEQKEIEMIKVIEKIRET